MKLHQFQWLLHPTPCEVRTLTLRANLYTYNKHECIHTFLEWSPDHAAAEAGSSQSQLLAVWNEDRLGEHTYWLIEILQDHNTCICMCVCMSKSQCHV